MISIVIPTYEQKGHGAAMLSKLLQSISEQTMPVDRFEVVISDNSKDDSVMEVANSFTGLDIRYHRNLVAIGVSANSNNAIEKSRYDKVKIMYMDDVFLESTALQKFHDALLEHKWVISNSYYINAEGERTNHITAEFKIDLTRAGNHIGMPSVIAFRKNHIRFHPQLKSGLDKFFYYQLRQQYGMPHFIREPLIGQRIWNGSISANQKDYNREDFKVLVAAGLVPMPMVRTSRH